MIKEFPTLFDVAKTGKIKQWRVWVEYKVNKLAAVMPRAIITVEHGYTDGKKQLSTESVLEGKNIGKANETTVWDQAVSQAEAMWVKQQKKGYVTDVSHAMTKPKERLPMLAHKFSERGHDIEFPCYMQPKLNGNRMLCADLGDKTEMTSRGGERLNIAHLDAAIAGLAQAETLDGELYIHGVPLQTIAGAVKKDKPLTKELEYWVYDIAIDGGVPFEHRLALLERIVEQIGNDKVKLVPTFLVNDLAEVMQRHEEFKAQGYEGSMLRNRMGEYVFKHRSVNLQKMKDFVDGEFKVLGCSTGTPGTKFDGVAIWNCVAENDKTFDVVCEGTIPMKKQQWIDYQKDPGQFIGKLLTVRYQELSEDGAPMFPVGVAFRESWDM